MKRELTKDQLRTRELVSAMSPKEKAKYYTDTYKWHALGGTIVAALLIWLIVTQLTHKDPLFYIGIVNSTNINHTALVEGIEEKLGVNTVSFYRDLGAGEANFNGDFNMLTVYLASGELNIIIGDDTAVTFLTNQALGEDVSVWASPELMELWSDRITCFEVAVNPYDAMNEELSDLETVSRPVTFDISGTKLSKELLLDDNIKYIMAIYTEGYEEGFKAFCDYLAETEAQ